MQPIAFVFWHSRCSAPEFASKGQAVNTKIYCNVYCCLRETIWQKWHQQWSEVNWLLNDDNAPSHWVLVTNNFFMPLPPQNIIITLPHPLYSLVSAPSGFFLFLKMKLQLKVATLTEWWRYSRNQRRFLVHSVNRTSSSCFSSSSDSGWDQYISVQGDYFEGDAAQT